MSYSSPSFTVGNVLRRGVDVFIANAGRYIGMMLLAFLPVVAIAVALPLLARSPGDAAALWPVFVGMYVVVLAGITVVMGATTHAAVASMQDRPVRIGESLAVGLSRCLPLLGVLIVVGFGMAVGFVLLIVPGILFGLAFFMALPIAVMERRGVFGSLAEAAELSRGYRGTLFGITVCYFLISIAGNMMMSYGFKPLFGLLAGVMGQLAILPIALLVIVSIVSAVALMAYQYVLIAVSYQMLRRERHTDEDDKLAGVFA